SSHDRTSLPPPLFWQLEHVFCLEATQDFFTGCGGLSLSTGLPDCFGAGGVFSIRFSVLLKRFSSLTVAPSGFFGTVIPNFPDGISKMANVTGCSATLYAKNTSVSAMEGVSRRPSLTPRPTGRR